MGLTDGATATVTMMTHTATVMTHTGTAASGGAARAPTEMETAAGTPAAEMHPPRITTKARYRKFSHVSLRVFRAHASAV